MNFFIHTLVSPHQKACINKSPGVLFDIYVALLLVIIRLALYDYKICYENFSIQALFLSLVLPFLTYWAFTAFISKFIKGRVAIVWLAFVYALSGGGLWQSEWSYYLGSFSLFFLLAAFLAFMAAPTWKGSLLFAFALITQTICLNCWTVYYFWLYLIFFVSYFRVFPHRVKRITHFILALPRGNKAILFLMILGAVSIAALWILLFSHVAKEQEGKQLSLSLQADYGEDESALASKQRIDQYTIGLFNPKIAVTTDQCETIKITDNYLSLTTVPLLLILILVRRKNILVCLGGCAIAIFLLCLVSPLLFNLGEISSRIKHLPHAFYFYSQYWQIILIFLAAAALDICSTRKSNDNAIEKKRLGVLFGILTVLCICAFVFCAFISPQYKANEQAMQSALYITSILIVSVILLSKLTSETDIKLRQVFSSIFLLITFADMSPYFVQKKEAAALYLGSQIKLSSTIQSSTIFNLVRNASLKDRLQPGIETQPQKYSTENTELHSDLLKSLEQISPPECDAQDTSYALDEINHFRYVGKSKIVIDYDKEDDFTFSGWLVSAKDYSLEGGVIGIVDDRHVIPAKYKLSRADVAEYLANSKSTCCGYAGSCPLSLLGKGKHVLSLAAITADQMHYYRLKTTYYFWIK